MFKFLFRTLASPYVRAGREVLKTKNQLAAGVQSFKEAKARGFQEPPSMEPDIVAARQVLGGRERFDFLLKLNGFTPEKLAARLVLLKRTQAIYLFCSDLALVAKYAFAAKMATAQGAWPLFTFGSLGVLSFFIFWVLMIRVAKTAIFKTQVQDHNLMSAREFVSRPDSTRKILLPFS